MAKKARARLAAMIDCACVIHGTAYDWVYVERLYNMLNKHIPQGIRLHVYTEHDRPVPEPMIKHELQEWPGVAGPRKSWWYKMQLFNSAHYQGNLFYIDLDTIILEDLGWVFSHSTDYFWTIRDFKYLQRNTVSTMNSSVMWFNTEKFGWVYDKFVNEHLPTIMRTYPGDQDYLEAVINHNQRRFLDITKFASFRWQAYRGGMNWQTRQPNKPDAGTNIPPGTSVLVFHGKPKPHEVNCPIVKQLWQ